MDGDQIVDVVLWIVTSYQPSVEIYNFLNSSQIPHRLVRLDTKKSRERAMNGKNIQITNVPTLTITISNGSQTRIEKIESYDSILQWGNEILRKKNGDVEQNNNPTQHRKQKKRKPQRKKKPRKKNNFEEVDIDLIDDAEINTDTTTIIDESPLKRKNKKMYSNDLSSNDSLSGTSTNLSVSEPNNVNSGSMNSIEAMAAEMRKQAENYYEN